jgi:hypothetical protein
MEILQPGHSTTPDRENAAGRPAGSPREVPPAFEYRITQNSGEVRWMNQRNLLIRDDGHFLVIEAILPP